MTKNELNKLNLQTKDGVFTPTYIFEGLEPVYENDELVDYNYIGFKLILTADENYTEWLQNKDKPPQLTEVEVLTTKLEFATKQLEHQEELIVELAMKVYQ